MTEHELQKKCNEYLRKNNILYYHKQRGRHEKNLSQSKGLPDLIVWNNGCCTFIELKTMSGVVSEAQQDYFSKVTRSGFHSWVCRSFEEFIHALEEEGIIQ